MSWLIQRRCVTAGGRIAGCVHRPGIVIDGYHHRAGDGAPRRDSAFLARFRDPNSVSTLSQFFDDLRSNISVDGEASGSDKRSSAVGIWVKGVQVMTCAEPWRGNRLLWKHAELDMVEK